MVASKMLFFYSLLTDNNNKSVKCILRLISAYSQLNLHYRCKWADFICRLFSLKLWTTFVSILAFLFCLAVWLVMNTWSRSIRRLYIFNLKNELQKIFFSFPNKSPAKYTFSMFKCSYYMHASRVCILIP